MTSELDSNVRNSSRYERQRIPFCRPSGVLTNRWTLLGAFLPSDS